MSENKEPIDYSSLAEIGRSGEETAKLDVLSQLKGDSSSEARSIVLLMAKDSSIKVRASAQVILKNNVNSTNNNVNSAKPGISDMIKIDEEITYFIIIPFVILNFLGLLTPLIPAAVFFIGFTYIILYISIKFDKPIAISASFFVIIFSLITNYSGLIVNYRPTLVTIITQLGISIFVASFVSELKNERDIKESTNNTLRTQIAALKELVGKKKSQSKYEKDLDDVDRLKEELKVKSRKTLEIITQLNMLIAERTSNGVIQRIAKIFKNQLSIERFSVWFIDFSKHEIYPVYSTLHDVKLNVSIPLVQNTILTKVAREGGLIDLKDLKLDASVFEQMNETRSFPTSLAIALEGVDSSGKPKIVGVINIEDSDFCERKTHEESELVKTIARNSAYALSWSGDLELARSDLQNIKEISEIEKEEKKKIKNLFGKFVAPSVVDEILKNPDNISLGGKRRRLTLFFADIRGFTAMSEKMADRPEMVIEIVNLFLSTMTNIIINKGGTLDKYMGDALMALFGAPISRPDDAYRAVEAAVVIRQETQKIWEKLVKSKKIAVNVGIGINTGEAVVGMMGSNSMMNYTAIGDSVNTAARIEANAKGGQILISKDTFNEVKEYVKAKELPPIKVKGKTKAVEIYEVEDLTDMFLI